MDVQIKLPEGVTKSKQLNIVMKTKSILIEVKGKESEPLLKGELCEGIITEDSFWNIEDGAYVNLNLEKAKEVIWKCVLLGDEEIDTKKVDNSKKLEEFDTETQGHLRKVLYE